MTSANDLAVVEMTNTTDRGLEVLLTMGGATRRITTLAPGASVVLVSPQGAYWSFASVPAPGPSNRVPPGGSVGSTNRTMSPDDDDADRGGEGAHRGGEGAHRGEEDEG